jgi:hypothetical protein
MVPVFQTLSHNISAAQNIFEKRFLSVFRQLGNVSTTMSQGNMVFTKHMIESWEHMKWAKHSERACNCATPAPPRSSLLFAPLRSSSFSLLLPLLLAIYSIYSIYSICSICSIYSSYSIYSIYRPLLKV